MVKDLLILAGGVALVVLGVPMTMSGHVQFGRGGHLMSSGASAIAFGVVLIMFAIADWLYRRRNT